MARLNSFLALTSLIFSIYFAVPALGYWEVTKPYPGHVVAIQEETIRVKCVIVNFANDTKHDNVKSIEFNKLLDQFGGKKLIVDDGIYSTENTTDYFDGVPRWNATMVIHNMTQAQVGQYECGVKGDPRASYAFGIEYIAKKDLPEIQYSRNITGNFNEPVSLFCDLIKKGNKVSVKLTSIAWFKGDTKLQEIKNFEENSLKNLNLTMNNASDAGNYKCLLTSRLGQPRIYEIIGAIEVQVRPKFMTKELDDNEIIKEKGQKATMKCTASGNPINIVWEKDLRSENKRTIINQTGYSNESIKTRYKISSSTKYQGFQLEILETDFEDRGDYYCCIRSSNLNASDQCQRFTLRVKDPLGYLWPLIGILIEAILIIIILLIAAKFKSKKDASFKSDANTELSYTISSEGSKGNVRLRKPGTTAN